MKAGIKLPQVSVKSTSRSMILAVTAIGCLIAAFTPRTSQGQGNKEVIVVNTTGNPVPVVPQGTTTVAGGVNVSNPAGGGGLVPLLVSMSAPIQIGNTEANPVQVRGPDTVLVYDEFLVGTEASPILDVRMFKQVRLVTNSPGQSTYGVRLEIIDDADFVVAPLDQLGPSYPYLTQVYDTPGTRLRIWLLQSPGSVRVQLYGRTN